MSKGAKASNHELSGMFPAIKPGGQTQIISYTGSSTQSAQSLALKTSIVKLFATTDCWVAMGVNPTAAQDTSPSFFMPGGTWDYFAIDHSSDAQWKVAAIRDTENGELHIQEGGF